MVGIKTLAIGYTIDYELAEEIARATGAKELAVETRPEGNTLMLSAEEQAEWRNRGWLLVGRTAKKTLVADHAGKHQPEKEKKREIQSEHGKEGYSEGGRLKAHMVVKTGSESIDGDYNDDDGTEEDDGGNESAMTWRRMQPSRVLERYQGA